MGAQEDPFYALRPPNSDVPTYLTFIEDNLTKDKLSTLQEVLQDAELIETIGWDLVKILVPLLPESEACLMDVARRGNPREVILKVAEAVREVKLAPDEDDEEEEEDEIAKEVKKSEDLPLPVRQFQVLLSMLTVLHPRIKAKYPSRFLSTTLQAVVAAHQNANIYHEELTDAVVKFVKTMTGNKRPHFPPRHSSSAMLVARTVDFAPDPEAQFDTPGTEEDKIHARLLQSFVTHILEDYLRCLRSHEDAPGLAWSSRYLEKTQHAFLNPNKTPLTEQFTKIEKLENRLTTVGQLVALAQDLEIHSDDVLATAMDPIPEIGGDIENEDEHPKSAESVPFSKTGSLYLFTARKAMEVLYDGPPITTAIDIFPQHATLIKNFLGSPSDTGVVGNEPEPLVDALLFLGLVALEDNAIGSPDSDDDFVEYLQSLSLLSSISASPSLRYHAHYLTSTILRSHPNDTLRFMFIRDTLEHAPFENLLASAVGWIKGETLEANQPRANPAGDISNLSIADDPDDPQPLFATDLPLASLAPLLFPDLTSQYSASSKPTTDEQVAAAATAYSDFRANYGFHFAALNFFFLLLLGRHLHEPLQIRKLTADGDVSRQFVQPLLRAAGYFGPLVAPGGALTDDFGGAGDLSAVNELEVLGMVATRVEAEIAKLGF